MFTGVTVSGESLQDSFCIRQYNDKTLVYLLVAVAFQPRGHILTKANKHCEAVEPPDLDHFRLPNILQHDSYLMMDHHGRDNDVRAFVNIRRTVIDEGRNCSYNTNGMVDGLRSSCPWRYVFNYDDNRRPKTLIEAKCNCNRSSGCLDGPPGSKCIPVKYYTRVLRKCGCENGVYQYRIVAEPINVGCTCAKLTSEIDV